MQTRAAYLKQLRPLTTNQCTRISPFVALYVELLETDWNRIKNVVLPEFRSYLIKLIRSPIKAVAALKSNIDTVRVYLTYDRH